MKKGTGQPQLWQMFQFPSSQIHHLEDRNVFIDSKNTVFIVCRNEGNHKEPDDGQFVTINVVFIWEVNSGKYTVVNLLL